MESAISRLRVFVAEQIRAGATQTALAKRFDMHQSKLSRILSGKLGVGRDEAFAIEAATRRSRGGCIRARDWLGYEPREAAR